MKNLLLTFILVLPCAAYAQDAPQIETAAKTKPIPIETTFSKPHIEVLKVEDSENRHYEKWRQKTLVVFGLIPEMNGPQTYEIETLKQIHFDLNLESKPKKGDFKKRLDELKKELETIDSESPTLKKWDSSRWTSKGDSTFPTYEVTGGTCGGRVYYSWFYREYEIEAIKQGKKTSFTGKIRVDNEGTISEGVPKGKTFDLETGEKVAGEIPIPKAKSELIERAN